MQPLRVLINNMLRTILNVRRDENNIPTITINQMYAHLQLLKFDDVSDYFFYEILP